MAVLPDNPNACPSCSGRGWKLARPRRSLTIGTLIRGAVLPTRKDCPDCEGPATVPPEAMADVLAAERFPGTTVAVGQAREFTRRTLGDGCPVLDDVLLMISEIAANAVRHTASGDEDGWFDVTVSMTGDLVRVSVTDRGGSSEPRTLDAGDDPDGDVLTGGRGLRIVDVLAHRWGHAGDELGRVVWFEVTGKPGS